MQIELDFKLKMCKTGEMRLHLDEFQLSLFIELKGGGEETVHFVLPI